MTDVLSYRNQSINVLCKSMDWFLYDRDLRHERVNSWFTVNPLPLDFHLKVMHTNYTVHTITVHTIHTIMSVFFVGH